MHLVLDLDETLVSVTHDPYHHVFIDESFNVGGQSFFLKKRPHLTEFLSFAFRNFKSVSVFTAGTRDYATEILRIIMTPEQRQKLMVFFSREHLQPLKNGSYTKALASICKTGGNPQQKQQQQGWESIYLPQQQQQRLAEKSKIIWKYLMQNEDKQYVDGEKYYNKLMQKQYQDKMKRKYKPTHKTSSFI